MNSRERSHGSVLLIPVTVLTKIVNFLPLREKMSFAKVCHEWRGFMLNTSHVWRDISIDWSTPFGGEWRKTGQHTNQTNSRMDETAKRKRYGMILERFILHLADMTDSIENFKISLSSWGNCPRSCGLETIESIHKLLINQKRLVSLSVALSTGRFISNDDPRKAECLLFEVIAKHQITLEHLELSNCVDMALMDWGRCLSPAGFPNLRSIGYPMTTMYYGNNPYDLPGQHYSSIVNDYRGALMHCFHQTLKYRTIEEINMSVDHFEISGWSKELSDGLISFVKQGLTPNLKKLLFDSVAYSGFGCFNKAAHERNAVDILIKSCPKLTHIHCFFDYNHALPLLVTHYNKNLVSLKCAIDDALAETISSECENLTELNVLSCYSNRGVRLLGLSNRGLFKLSGLGKLKCFCLTVDSPETLTSKGIITFLFNSVTNLEELRLNLPCYFYKEKNIYDMISKSSASFKGISLELNCDCFKAMDGPHKIFKITRSQDEMLDQRTFLEGINRMILTCDPLKYLSIYNQEHLFRDEEETILERIKIIFLSVVTFQSHMDSFRFKIGVDIPKGERDFIIKSLPYCRINFD